MLLIKKGVKLHSLSPQMSIALTIINQECNDRLIDCIITSGSEGKHKVGSFHYVGNALDFRTFYDPSDPKGCNQTICSRIALHLGENYDVVIEPTCVHVEYDPHK